MKISPVNIFTNLKYKFSPNDETLKNIVKLFTFTAQVFSSTNEITALPTITNHSTNKHAFDRFKRDTEPSKSNYLRFKNKLLTEVLE